MAFSDRDEGKGIDMVRVAEEKGPGSTVEPTYHTHAAALLTCGDVRQ